MFLYEGVNSSPLYTSIILAISSDVECFCELRCTSNGWQEILSKKHFSSVSWLRKNVCEQYFHYWCILIYEKKLYHWLFVWFSTHRGQLHNKEFLSQHKDTIFLTQSLLDYMQSSCYIEVLWPASISKKRSSVACFNILKDFPSWNMFLSLKPWDWIWSHWIWSYQFKVLQKILGCRAAENLSNCKLIWHCYVHISEL